MKKIILASAILMSSLLANSTDVVAGTEIPIKIFKKYTSYSSDINMDNIVKTEELFFGVNTEYKEISTTIVAENIAPHAFNGLLIGVSSAGSAIAKGALKQGLDGGIMGLAIGLTVGTIQAVIDTNKMSERDKSSFESIYIPFYLVEKLTNDKGETTVKRTMATLTPFVFSRWNKTPDNTENLRIVKNKIKGI